MRTVQFYLTPAAGKRLIAKGAAALPAVRTALLRGVVVVVAGTTGGQVAQELLTAVCQASGFDPRRFYRGLIRAKSQPAALPPLAEDVVLEKGIWRRGQTIFDVADRLGPEDVILKGANALDLAANEAAVLIGNPGGGTMTAITAAVAGRRAQLILPVGLEKRVQGPLQALCLACGDPEAEGLRLWRAPGVPFTELDAVRQLSGATARLFAAGGVCGAEGGCYLAITGTDTQLEIAQTLIAGLLATPPFTLE